MNDIPKIAVLMSTYNGQHFIEEQLQSIFAQKEVSVELFVRDDGSTDNTLQILERWAESHPLHLTQGQNIGPARSFLELLSTTEAPFYAFADQDDLWDDDKLATGIKAIAGLAEPALYFSDTTLVDEKGRFIGNSIGHELNITKGNALIETFSAGCTMVLNRRLRDIVVENLPEEFVYHDRWAFLTAVFLGKVVYDSTPHIAYRQHGGNVLGAHTEEEKGKSLRRIEKKIEFPRGVAAGQLLKRYKQQLTQSDISLIANCCNYDHRFLSRLRLAFYPSYRLAYGGVARRLYWTLRILMKKI